ncbi:MAG: hypothetical protein AAF943_13920 [Pseudomonadota bacterium]
MSDATYTPRLIAPASDGPTSDVRPKPQPLAAPVFISDCVTPLGGETLLSLLMKRLARDAEEE